MDNWVGFSDEELRRLKGQQGNEAAQSKLRQTRGRPATVRGRASPNDRTMPKKSVDPTRMNKVVSKSELPPEARLSKPPPEVRPTPSTEKQLNKTNQEQKDSNLPGGKTKVNSAPPKPNQPAADYAQKEPNPARKDENLDENDMVLDEKDIIKQELNNVVKFQFQQKLIEEQNKKKRELLSTAIVERQKKAKQEASRLTRIQKDLSQLDQLLAIDVSIIRNKIEEASREYLDAQKRFERAEKEYIESKMDLHQKTELKDSLTEHLHLVIHQNEVRKAKKLTELMQKLSMEDGEEVHVEGLDSEELAKTAPSFFILGSLHSTQEQNMIMHRSRRLSESDHHAQSHPVSPMKRSTSDHDGKPQGGVSGWISGLIFGSPPQTNTDSSGAVDNKPQGPSQVIVAAPVSSNSPVKDIATTETKSLDKSDKEKTAVDVEKTGDQNLRPIVAAVEPNASEQTQNSDESKPAETFTKPISVGIEKEPEKTTSSPITEPLPESSGVRETKVSSSVMDTNKSPDINENRMEIKDQTTR